MTRITLVFLLIILFVLVVSCGGQETDFDQQELEAAEDLSESLANDLLRFSVAVRDGDLNGIRNHFAGELEATAWPASEPELKPVAPNILQGGWELDTTVSTVSGEQFLDQFLRFTGMFTSIEDARFKVKTAHFNEETGMSGEAHLKFFLVGRDNEGNRQWFKGTGHAGLARSEGSPWMLDRLTLDTVTVKKSVTERKVLPTCFPRLPVRPASGRSSLRPARGRTRASSLTAQQPPTSTVTACWISPLPAWIRTTCT